MRISGGRRVRLRSIRGRWIAGAAIGIAAATLAGAQDEGGLTARFDVSSGIRLRDSTASGTDTVLTTSLGVDLVSQTRSQRLSFGLSGLIEAGDDGVALFPRASLGYRRTGKSAEFGLDLGYSQEEVDGSVLIDDFTGPELVADGGTRQNLTAALNLVTGSDARFGTDTRLSFSQRRYIETADPDLFDQDAWQAATTLRFVISPTVSMRLDARYGETHNDDATDRVERSSRLGLGADIEVNPVWTVSADLGLADIETREDDGLGGRSVTSEAGSEFRLSGVRRLPNDGQLSFSASRVVSAAGARLELGAARTLTTRNSSLDASVGLVRFEEAGSTAAVAALTYALALPSDATISVSYSRSADTDDEARDIVRDQLAASFSQPLTEVANWTIDTSLARVDVVDATAGDAARAEIGLSYQHTLTRDWSLSVGVEHARVYEGGAEADRSNTLFATIGRSFAFRP